MVGQAQLAAVAALPELYERGRQQRKGAGLALDLGDQRPGQLRLDPHACVFGRAFDRAPQLVPGHRTYQHLVLGQERR